MTTDRLYVRCTKCQQPMGGAAREHHCELRGCPWCSRCSSAAREK